MSSGHHAGHIGARFQGRAGPGSVSDAVGSEQTAPRACAWAWHVSVAAFAIVRSGTPTAEYVNSYIYLRRRGPSRHWEKQACGEMTPFIVTSN